MTVKICLSCRCGATAVFEDAAPLPNAINGDRTADANGRRLQIEIGAWEWMRLHALCTQQPLLQNITGDVTITAANVQVVRAS